MKVIERKENLRESGLSRLNDQILIHDCGMLTAFRGHFTKKENKQRNRELWTILGQKGYGVTSIDGAYIEDYLSEINAKEVAEESFFVVDLQNKGNLEKDLRVLGERFLQDSILYIHNGEGYLIGTTPYKNNSSAYPPYGVTEYQGFCFFGQSGEFFSRIKNRPFVFKSK